MKKTAKKGDLEMQKEYDFSHAKRGIAHRRYSSSLRIALLTPENHRRFPDSESVNAALEKVIKIEETLRAANG